MAVRTTDKLVRGTYLSTRADGYANVLVSARVGMSRTVFARIGIPTLLVQNDIVYLLQEEVTGNNYVIVASLNKNVGVDSVAYVPTGGVVMMAGSTAPNGFLLCDGSTVSRSTFSALFDKIGTTFGVGDGSTTFNVPNLASSYTGIVNIIKT